jgi:hypothetical protein
MNYATMQCPWERTDTKLLSTQVSNLPGDADKRLVKSRPRYRSAVGLLGWPQYMALVKLRFEYGLKLPRGPELERVETCKLRRR